MEEQKKKKEWKDFTTGEKVRGVGCMGIIILVAFIIFGSKGASDTKVLGCEQYNTNAIVMARNFMEDHLEYAGSSHIPSAFESLGAISCKDKLFTFVDWVEASNAFGAKRKVYYTIQLEFLGGEWTRKSSWKEVSFNFAGGV